MTTPKSEPGAVRHAVLESLRISTVTDELARLVHRMARKRCGPALCEDVGQEVLLGLVRHLDRIDADRDVYHLIGKSIGNTWRHMLRHHRQQRGRLRHLMGVLLDDIPSSHRPTASRQAKASMRGILRQKYYA
jgi:DNA-directed RNA polymerase specialized sigma24 family protein